MQESVRRLLLEKRDIWRQLLETKRVQISVGGGGDDIIAVTLNLLAVELELAQSRAERIAILEKMLKEVRKYEEIAESQRAQGVGGAESVFEARLKRLDYQIKLEEEKAKKP